VYPTSGVGVVVAIIVVAVVAEGSIVAEAGDAVVSLEATMPLAPMGPLLTASIPGSALTESAMEAPSVLVVDIFDVRVSALTPMGT
jgi:hypothetical protein